jgi:hypothetical protein
MTVSIVVPGKGMVGMRVDDRRAGVWIGWRFADI